MKRIIKYLLWAFGVAWILQIIAGVLFRKGYIMAYSSVLALSMFSPLLAVIISKSDMKKLDGNPI